MDTNKILMAVIVGALLAIVGAVLTGVIGDEVDPLIDLQAVGNETLTLTPAHIAGNDDLDNATNFNMSNGNISSLTLAFINGTLLTVDTDYTVDYATGFVNLLNNSEMRNYTANTDNTTMANYSYQHADYLTSPTDRSLIGLVGFLFVVGLLLMMYRKMRDSGMDDIFKK